MPKIKKIIESHFQHFQVMFWLF